MRILGLLGVYLDAVVEFVTSHSLWFRLAVAILWLVPKVKGDVTNWVFKEIYYIDVTWFFMTRQRIYWSIVLWEKYFRLTKVSSLHFSIVWPKSIYWFSKPCSESSINNKNHWVFLKFSCNVKLLGNAPHLRSSLTMAKSFITSKTLVFIFISDSLHGFENQLMTLGQISDDSIQGSI